MDAFLPLSRLKCGFYHKDIQMTSDQTKKKKCLSLKMCYFNFYFKQLKTMNLSHKNKKIKAECL